MDTEFPQIYYTGTTHKLKVFNTHSFHITSSISKGKIKIFEEYECEMLSF